MQRFTRADATSLQPVRPLPTWFSVISSAVDQSILRELAQNHGLPAVAPAPDRTKLALELLSKVQALPEIVAVLPGNEPEIECRAVEATTEPRAKRDGLRTGKSGVNNPATKTSVANGIAGLINDANKLNPANSSPNANWPLLRTTMANRPLVIVGGSPHLERLASLALGSEGQVEWVDTTRQGTHAIGNLERRIKDKRIGALLILEGLVQHRHSDPLVSTARGAHVPHAYGGKGGRSTIAHALDELELMLSQQRR
ncbi:MAG: hypothetical protein QM784_03045 [Polyangiaceae bacterium]